MTMPLGKPTIHLAPCSQTIARWFMMSMNRLVFMPHSKRWFTDSYNGRARFLFRSDQRSSAYVVCLSRELTLMMLLSGASVARRWQGQATEKQAAKSFR